MPRTLPPLRVLNSQAARLGGAYGALAVLMLTAGCATAIRWEGPTFSEAQSRARERGELTFVYFRSWYLVECTDFEDRVLKAPDVVAACRDMTCVVLDYDWDKPLARQWSLDAPPAFALVSPDGELLAKQHAPITHNELIEAIRAARTRYAASTQPAPRRGASAR